MQPIEETRERLFPWLCRDQLFFFSCGHIVPPQSILPIVVSHGPSGKSFDFSYTSRSSPSTVSICNILLVCPRRVFLTTACIGHFLLNFINLVDIDFSWLFIYLLWATWLGCNFLYWAQGLWWGSKLTGAVDQPRPEVGHSHLSIIDGKWLGILPTKDLLRTRS